MYLKFYLENQRMSVEDEVNDICKRLFKVMFRIEKNLVDIDYEMYAEEGKHLKEMLYDLVVVKLCAL